MPSIAGVPGWAFVLGALWTAPNTLIGLLLGLPTLMFGARLRIGDGALLFLGVRAGQSGALTLGNTILCTDPNLERRCHSYVQRALALAERREPCESPMRLGDHERAHVYQYLVLGPLFLPLYFLCGGISARNRFERAADRYGFSGHGWWPWHGQP